MRIAICIYMLVALGLPSIGQAAATIQVPQQWDRISSAVQAALPGDTILITNSATYTEQINLTKPVTIKAAPGANPTITSSSLVMLFSPGSEGAQLGSLDGGRITISGVGATSVQVSTTDTTDTTPVLLENLQIEGTGTIVFLITGRGSRATLTHSVIDGKNAAARGIFASFNPATPNGQLNLDRVRVFNTTNFVFWSYSTATSAGWPTTPVFMTYNFNRCEFDGRTAQRNGQSNYTTMLINRNSRPTLTMSDSLVFGTKGCLDQFWNLATAYDHAADTAAISTSLYERCVFIQPEMAADAVVADKNYDVIRFGLHSRWDVTFDHCDIINLGTDPKIGINFQATLATHLNREQANRRLTVKSTNVVTPGNGFTATLSGLDAVTSNYNNILAGGTAYTGLQAGPQDMVPALDPQYFNAASGDVRYANDSLKRAGENNTAIGVNASYANVLSEIIPGPMPVNNARHWELFY